MNIRRRINLFKPLMAPHAAEGLAREINIKCDGYTPFAPCQNMDTKPIEVNSLGSIIMRNLCSVCESKILPPLRIGGGWK